MSLYRSWRPRSFADLVGQDAVVRTLTTALETGRLAHAYLFSGPRGSGKTSAAKILARCIECVHGPTATPDNTCENCVAILEGTALDVLEIDAASNRGIDEIRALRDAVKFAPSTMRSKVYIIDEAHMLTKEGANAFLKTLEEPPEWAVFILATTAPEALPPTILSRCQRYAFRRIPIATMIERMRTIADAEHIAIDDGALAAIAYRADGGLRDALTMLEQVASFAGAQSGGAGRVDLGTVDAAFGQTAREDATRLRDAALDADPTTVLRIIDAATDAGADLSTLLRATLAEFRHLLVARINPELLARDLAADDAAAATARAEATPQHRIMRALRLLSEAQAAARGTGNPRLELETALLRFVLQAEDPTLDALAARVTELESGGRISAMPTPPPTAAPASTPAPPSAAPPTAASAPAAPRPPARAPQAPPPTTPVAGAAQGESPRAAQAPAAPRPGAPPAPPVGGAEPEAQRPQTSARAAGDDVTLQKVKARWSAVSARAEEKKRSISSGLGRAMVTSLEGNALLLTVPDPFAQKVITDAMPVLQEAIADVLGTTLSVRVNVARGAAPASDDPPSAPTADDDDLQRYAFEKLL